MAQSKVEEMMELVVSEYEKGLDGGVKELLTRHLMVTREGGVVEEEVEAYSLAVRKARDIALQAGELPALTSFHPHNTASTTTSGTTTWPTSFHDVFSLYSFLYRMDQCREILPGIDAEDQSRLDYLLGWVNGVMREEEGEETTISAMTTTTTGSSQEEELLVPPSSTPRRNSAVI